MRVQRRPARARTVGDRAGGGAERAADGEFLRKVEEFVRRLGIKVRGDGDNEISIAFPNGSRIVGLPGNEVTARGYSASLLLIDEAARVDDRFYRAMRPSLAATNGDLWLMSTPFGKRGFFWEEWEHGGEEWERVSAKATECGRISGEFLERQRRKMGAAWFGQEFLCEFVDNGSRVFSRDVVERAVR